MIGEILRRMRMIYNYKANEMCEKLGISNSYLSEIENEKKKPTLDLMQKYADIFRIKLSSLILLAEDVANENNSEKSQQFIKKLMERLVFFMTKDGEP